MCVGKVLLSRSLFICFLFFDNFHSREMQDLKLCMCTQSRSDAQLVQIPDISGALLTHPSSMSALIYLQTTHVRKLLGTVWPHMPCGQLPRDGLPVQESVPLGHLCTHLSPFTRVMMVRPLMTFEPKIPWDLNRFAHRNKRGVKHFVPFELSHW